MADEDKKIFLSSYFKAYIWVVSVVWTTVIFASLSWNLVYQRKEM